MRTEAFSISVPLLLTLGLILVVGALPSLLLASSPNPVQATSQPQPSEITVEYQHQAINYLPFSELRVTDAITGQLIGLPMSLTHVWEAMVLAEWGVIELPPARPTPPNPDPDPDLAQALEAEARVERGT